MNLSTSWTTTHNVKTSFEQPYAHQAKPCRLCTVNTAAEAVLPIWQSGFLYFPAIPISYILEIAVKFCSVYSEYLPAVFSVLRECILLYINLRAIMTVACTYWKRPLVVLRQDL